MIWISDLRDASQRYSKIRSVGEVFTKNAISAIKNTFLLFDVSYSLKGSFLFGGRWKNAKNCFISIDLARNGASSARALTLLPTSLPTLLHFRSLK